VSLLGSSRARVEYSIELAGKTALAETGVAVLRNGVRQVGDQSFCALLGLQGTLPGICRK
jgi:hypothetical protein